MTEIRILLYTDYNVIGETPSLNSWGITELEKFILYKTEGVADFKLHFLNRHEPKPKSNPLTRKLLYQYDELWVFGFHRPRAVPYELDAQEVDVLKEWMDNGGGLFMAGDHAAGLCATADPKTFSVWGRSLGEPMKRAGQLRVWQGPPTGCPHPKLEDRDNFNTCEGSNPQFLDRPELQSDGRPQTLLHLSDPPHRLFWWRKDSSGKMLPITVFPDHHHEGKLIIPDELGGDWPPHSPLPVVAAEGRDKRFPNEDRRYKLVIAYDGDSVKVGRIVVDSSFHHYLNINLSDLHARDAAGYPVENSDLDQIAQYYGNLAYWLAPQALRDEIKFNLFFRLAEHPDVFEVSGSGCQSLGQAAQYVLDLQIGASNLHRIFAPSEFEMTPRLIDELLALFFLGENSLVELTPVERSSALGAVINVYHEFVAESGVDTPSELDERPLLLDILARGITSASKVYPFVTEKLSPFFN